jgi:hypothetical protein
MINFAKQIKLRFISQKRMLSIRLTDTEIFDKLDINKYFINFIKLYFLFISVFYIIGILLSRDDLFYVPIRLLKFIFILIL